MSFGRVEALTADGLELQATHERVEEDLEEVQMISIGLFHELDPLDRDLVLDPLMLRLEHWQPRCLLERVDTVAPVDEEVQVLLDLVFHCAKDSSTHFTRVLGNLRVELAGVLVDALDGGRIELE